MPPLRVEVYNESQQEWHEVSTINPGDPYGSFSDNAEHGRDVYYFGVDIIEGKAVIKKTGFSIDIATETERTIHEVGRTTLVAGLDPGQEFEMVVRTDKSGNNDRKIKFTHLND